MAASIVVRAPVAPLAEEIARLPKPEAIVVESDQCDDAEMGALVDRMRGTLDEAGFAKVTCSSKFGATVFEKQWRKLAAEDNDPSGADGAE